MGEKLNQIQDIITLKVKILETGPILIPYQLCLIVKLCPTGQSLFLVAEQLYKQVRVFVCVSVDKNKV